MSDARTHRKTAVQWLKRNRIFATSDNDITTWVVEQMASGKLLRRREVVSVMISWQMDAKFRHIRRQRRLRWLKLARAATIPGWQSDDDGLSWWNNDLRGRCGGPEVILLVDGHEWQRSPKDDGPRESWSDPIEAMRMITAEHRDSSNELND